MMKIEQKRLKAFYDILRALVPEVRLMITPDGWNTLAVDTANVAMVSVNLPKDQFAAYQDETKSEIGLDLGKLKNMLEAMKDPESRITIERVKDTQRIKATDGRYSYTISPLDPATLRKRPNPPNLALPASIAIDGKELHETIRALAHISDKVKMTVSKEGGLACYADGDTDHLRKDLPAGVDSKLPETPLTSLFSLDYLSDMTRAMKDVGTVTISMSQDHPVRFDFITEGMECSYLLAPRLEAQ